MRRTMRTTNWIRRMVLALSLLGLASGAMACNGSEPADPDAPDSAESAEDAGGEAADAELPPGLVAGDPANGEERFTPCAGCHGADATGIEGLGKNLRTSEFLDGLSDAEAVTFLKEGRPAGHPLNTTGVDMPPKGGDPTLSEQDLLDIVAYLRGLE